MLHDMTPTDHKWAHLIKSKNHFLCPNIHNKIPVAILLILADELSIFDRHRIKGDTAEKAVTLKYDERWDKHVPKSIEIAFQNGKVQIKSRTSRSDALTDAFRSLEVFRITDKKYKLFDYEMHFDN